MSPLDGADTQHNRLTHVLKVAQLGRRLAENLQFIESKKTKNSRLTVDPDVVETACLSHDLGHPPFGHIAEQALDDCVKNEGLQEGFEGNAQSFRIVTQLEAHNKDFHGLNLCRATLAAILKYPNLWDPNCIKKSQKYGVYVSDEKIYNWVGVNGTRSLEADIMDWADDLTYCLHDLEDFVRNHKIPNDLADNDGELESLLNYMVEQKNITEEERAKYKNSGAFILSLMRPKSRDGYSGKEVERIHIKAGVSYFLSKAVSETIIDNGKLVRPMQVVEWVIFLKACLWYYVIDQEDLRKLQAWQKIVIRDVFKKYLGDFRGNNFSHVAPAFEERASKIMRDDNKGMVRLVCDYIAGMSEQQVISEYRSIISVPWASC